MKRWRSKIFPPKYCFSNTFRKIDKNMPRLHSAHPDLSLFFLLYLTLKLRISPPIVCFKIRSTVLWRPKVLGISKISHGLPLTLLGSVNDNGMAQGAGHCGPARCQAIFKTHIKNISSAFPFQNWVLRCTCSHVPSLVLSPT